MGDVRIKKITNNLISLMRMFSIMSSSSKKGGLNPHPSDPQYWILGSLQHGNLSISELGKRIQRSKQSMTCIMERLLAEGKIERLSDKKDRRVARIAISEKGKKFIRKSKAIVTRNIEENLSNLSDIEKDVLSESLENIGKIVPRIMEESKNAKRRR